MSISTRHSPRARKNREMLIRALADAVQRAEELAQNDPAFARVENEARMVWARAIRRDRELREAAAFHAHRLAAAQEVAS